MKKILLFMVSLVIFLLSTTTFCFASEFDDYVKAVNSKYNLEITKVDGIEEKCTFDEFKQNIDAHVETHLLNKELEREYFLRKSNNKFLAFNHNVENIGTFGTYTTVTQTKKSNSSRFKIKTTFDYYNGTPKNVKNFRNISFSYAIPIIYTYFRPNTGYPKTSIIDSGRTGVIEYVGYYKDDYIKDNNFRFFAEFYAP